MTEEERKADNAKAKARKGKGKAKKLEATASDAFRATERQQRGHAHSTQAAVDNMVSVARRKKIMEAASVAKTNFPLQDIVRGESHFVPGPVDPNSGGRTYLQDGAQSTCLDPDCNDMVRDCVENRQYTYVVNDLR